MNYEIKESETSTEVIFGELDFNTSTQKYHWYYKMCGIEFSKEESNNIHFSNLDTLKDPCIFDVIEDFLYSKIYKETPEDLVKCLEFWGYEKLDPTDLNTETDKLDMEC